MSLEKQMKTGQVYVEFGHSDPADIAYEKVTEDQRLLAKDLCYDYNNTRPTDIKSREEILKKLLGAAGEGLWMEPPIHFAYGSNTYMGHHVYANFNLTVVDDGECRIGN